MTRSPFQRPTATPLVRAKADTVEMLLYDEIGYFGITAKAFATALTEVKAETIHLRVNSPGGDVFDGVAIYNALRQHSAKVITHVDGLAASIASVIALAGNEVRMAPNAFFMVHNPFGITIGTAEDHRKTAAMLDKIRAGAIANTYQSKTGADMETIETWMDDETWFNATEAAAAGFVDVVDDPIPSDTTVEPFDLSMYQHVPAALTARPVGESRIAGGLAARRAMPEWMMRYQFQNIARIGETITVGRETVLKYVLKEMPHA